MYNIVNTRRRMITIIMTILMLLSPITNSIMGIENSNIVYAETEDYDYAKISVQPLENNNWNINDSNDLAKAFTLLQDNFNKLGDAKVKMDSILSTRIEKDSEHLNVITRFELIRVQTLFLVNLIEHQVEARDNLTLSEEQKSFIDDMVKILLTSTQEGSYQEKYTKAHELYKTCEDGQQSCGPRTEGTSGNLTPGNGLKVPAMVTSETGSVTTMADGEKTRLLEELKTITQMINSMMDLTEPTNVGTSGSSGRQKWLTDNAKLIVDRMKQMVSLVSVYNGLGLGDEVSASDGLKARLESNKAKLDELLKAANLNIDTDILGANPIEQGEEGNISENPLKDVDLNSIGDLVDKKKNDLSDTYKGLFAWTANFTPFETNINDSYIMESLTKEEKTAYTKYGAKRSIVYSAIGDKGVAKGLKESVPYQFKILSLGEFIDKVDVKEMVLFIKNQSTYADQGNGISTNNQTGEVNTPMSNTTTPDTGNAPSIGNTQPSNTPPPPAQKEEETLLSRWFGKKDGKGTDASWYSISGNTEADGTGIIPQFVGPIYASSGSLPKKIWEVDDAGDKMQNIASVHFDYGKVKLEGGLKTQSNTAIGRLKGNTMNMNYFLMYNTLKNKSQLSQAIEEDLNKPIYVDFIGNILSQSGYVIVPAASNYTYYNFSNELPMFNAMFLNSYPEVVFNEKQTYTMMDTIEKEKLIYQKAKGGAIRIGKLDHTGTTIKDSFFSLPLLNKAKFEDGSVEVNFIDDITMYKQGSDPFTLSDNVDNTEQDLTFVNAGVVMKAVQEGVQRIVNLRKISGDGRGVDWRLIKDANLNLIKDSGDKKIDSITLSSLAGTVDKSTDGQVSVIVTDYVSKDEQIKTEGGITKFLGELFEGFHNKFINSLGVNYLLYTPKNTESFIFGSTAQVGAQVMIIVSIIAMFVFIVGFAMALYRRDMVGVKAISVSMVAIVLITAMSVFGTEPTIDLLYNKPAQTILRKELPIYILEDIEKTYKDQSTNFFDKSDKEIVEGNSTVTLEKLKNKDIELLRSELTQTGEKENAFYLPALDQSRLNIIGDKIYLQGRELRISTKDLMDISKVEDVLGPDQTLQLEATYSGYGELAYYMPYFNILDSLVGRINSYTEETKPPYRLIQYRKGFTKSTGRAEDFFKSVVFISPDMLDDHVRTLMREYQQNDVGKDYYTNQYSIDKNKKDKKEDDPNTGEEIPTETPTGEAVGPEKSDDIFGDYYFKEEILPIAMTNELLKELDNINNVVMYLNFHSNMDLADWLGLKKVLLLEEDEGLFPSNYHAEIMENKWFPNDLTDRAEEDILRDIYEINSNTRDFVIEKIIPISGKVSDDTLLKIVSLYATMEFNKVFQGEGPKLLPRSINTEGLSNDYTTKAVMIPQEQIFVGNSHRTALYLAKETGWAGLLLAFIDRLMYFLRMLIRITVLKVIVTLAPFVALYLYIRQKNKYSNFLMGAVVSSVGITFLYLIEVAWYRIAFLLVNSKGTMTTLKVGLIPQVLLTAIYFMLVRTILQDVSNFGFNGFRDKAMTAMGASRGVDWNETYEQVSRQSDYGYSTYDEGSNLSMTERDMVYGVGMEDTGPQSPYSTPYYEDDDYGYTNPQPSTYGEIDYDDQTYDDGDINSQDTQPRFKEVLWGEEEETKETETDIQRRLRELEENL